MKRVLSVSLILVVSACATGRNSENPENSGPATLTAEEARRLAEESYQEMLRRQEEEQRRQKEQPAKPETEKSEPDPRESAEETERREKERLKRQEDRQRESAEQERSLKQEAMSLRDKDRSEEAASVRAMEVYRKNRPLWTSEAASLMARDQAEQKQYDEERKRFVEERDREKAYRLSKLDKADPARDYFYRVDARSLFPAQFEIVDVRLRGIKLMRNRKPQQFMGFTKGMKYVPAVQPISLPGGVPSRLRMYEFLKGRPGNYVLLEDGQPITIRHRDRNYRIVNIHSDGDVLLLLDLERDDFSEYYRLSVEDMILVLE